MKKANECNMTEGSPVKVILLFALPILFGNVFQQLYNIVDTAVIGEPVIWGVCMVFVLVDFVVFLKKEKRSKAGEKGAAAKESFISDRGICNAVFARSGTNILFCGSLILILYVHIL